MAVIPRIFFPFFQFTLRDNKKLVPVTIIKQGNFVYFLEFFLNILQVSFKMNSSRKGVIML